MVLSKINGFVKKNAFGKRSLSVILSTALFITSVNIQAFADELNSGKSFFYAGKGYDSLYDAIDAARSEDNKDIEITVKDDLEISKGININEGENITIKAVDETGNKKEHKIIIDPDFDSKTDSVDKAEFFYVQNDASLTIDGFTFDGYEEDTNGQKTRGNLADKKCAFYCEGSLSFFNSEIKGFHHNKNVFVIDDGNLDFTGSEIDDFYSETKALISTKGTSGIKGGCFSNINARRGMNEGGLVLSSGVLVMDGITSSLGYVHTGGYVRAENLHMKDCNLEDVDFASNSGIVQLYGDGNSCIYNSSICGAYQSFYSNSVVNGVACDIHVGSGNVSLYDVTLGKTRKDNNHSSIHTHGMIVDNGNVTFEKEGEHDDEYLGKILSGRNVINGCDKGMVVESNGIVKAKALDITNNSSTDGAGILNKGKVELFDVNFKDNHASSYTDNKVFNKVKKGDDIYNKGELVLHEDVHFENNDNINILLSKEKVINVRDELKYHNATNSSINVGFDEDIVFDDYELIKYDENSELAYDAVRNGLWVIKSLGDEGKLLSDGESIVLGNENGRIRINVIDETGSKISGVIFELSKKTDDDKYKKVMISDASDEKGEINISKLIGGDYKLKCIYVPDGYKKENVNEIKFKLEKDKDIDVNIGRYNEAPVAKISIDGDEDKLNAYDEISFSAALSTDDTGIKRYSWDFGDGETVSGENVKHEYSMEGMYVVTLIVEDMDGRKSSTFKEVNIKGDGLIKITVKVKSTESDNFIPDSHVYVTDEKGKTLVEKNTKTGKAEFLTKPGINVNITAMAKGFQTRTTSALCKKDGTVTIYLSTRQTITAEVKTKELTLQEMKEAGIDVDSYKNRQIVKYELMLSFFPIKEVSFMVDPRTYEVLDSKGMLKNSKADCSVKPMVGKHNDLYLLIINGTNTWLKDMFEVELLMINNSRVEVVNDVEAKIILPEGLSLAKMCEDTNEETQKISSIDAQSSKSALWYVRGDVDGEYDIEAEVTGKMHKKEKTQDENNGDESNIQSDDLNDNQNDSQNNDEMEVDDFEFMYKFKTDEPVRVVSQSALGVVIELEETAATGDTYNVGFNYYNASDKSLYDLKFSIDGELQTSPGNRTYGKGILSIGTISGRTDDIENASFPSDRFISNGYVEELKPGDFVHFNYMTSITFLDAKGNDVITKLRSAALRILNGSTASMKVDFVWHETSRDRANYERAAMQSSVDFFGGDPVNLLTGGFSAEFTDIHISGYRDLDFIRYYDSVNDNEYDGWINGFGRGWSHNYDYKVIGFGIEDTPLLIDDIAGDVIGDEKAFHDDEYKYYIRIRTPNGKIHTFKKGVKHVNSKTDKMTINDLGGGEYESFDGLKLTIKKTGDTIDLIKMTDKGVVYTFDNDGKLLSIRDVEGFETKLVYDGGFLKSISNDVGKINVSWNMVASVISEISYEKNDESIKVEYGYENNLITSEKNPNGDVMNFTYVKVEVVDGGSKNNDEDNKDDGIASAIATTGNSDKSILLLKTISDYEGNVVVRNEYDSKRRVISQETGGKGTYTYEYDEKNHINTQTGYKGNEREIKYDENDLITSDRQKQDGVVRNKVTYEYNAKGLPVIIKDDNGERIIGYNACEDISRVLYPDGTSEEFDYDTDDTYLLIKMTDRNEVETKFSYENNLLKEKNIGNESTTFYTYDSCNRLQTESRGENVLKKIKYYDNGRIKKLEDGDGFTTSFSYDVLGNVIESIDQNGESKNYTYDKCGNLKEEEDELGRKIKYELDKCGNITKIRDKKKAYEEIKVNVNGDITTNISKLRNETRYEYDDYGNLKVKENPDKSTVSYVYDSYGNVIRKTDEENNKWKYYYDKLNRVDQVINPMGVSECFTYDTNGRVIRKTYDDASFESFEYDGLGRIKKETDRMGNEKTYDYDCRGNLIMFKDERGITTINSYDENNNLILSKTGEDTTKYEYDLRGNIKKETKERVHLNDEEEVVEKHVREYTYDFRNNVKTCIDENGNLTEYDYDEVGNLSTITYPDKTTVKNTYDKNGNLESTTNRNGKTIFYKYDSEDRLVKEVYEKNKEISYTYDYAGRILEKTYPEGKALKYTYFKTGELKTYENNESITEYERDALGRVKTETIKNKNDEEDKIVKKQYEYDIFGNITKMTDPSGETTYKYDGNGRLKRKIDAGGNKYYYEYDNRGNVTKEKYNTGKVISYKYDNQNLVIEKIIGFDGTLVKKSRKQSKDKGDNEDSDGEGSDGEDESNVIPEGLDETITCKYDYDIYGNLIRYTDGCGNVTVYERDALGNNVKTIDALGNVTEFTYDAFSNLITKKSSGKIDESYEYDNDNNLTSVKDSNGNIIKFDYDEYGNLTTRTEVASDPNEELNGDSVNDRVTSYEYDGLNRCTKVTNPDGGFEEYTYTSLDKIKTKKNALGITTYDYDYRGNLTSVTKPEGGKTSYSYDDNDNLIEIQKAKGGIIKYEHDAVGNLVTETDELGNVKEYTHDCFGNVLSEKNDNGEISYEYDLLNNVLNKQVKTGKDSKYYKFSYDKNGEVIGFVTCNDLKAEPENIVNITRDAVSNITSINDGKSIFDYSYDEDGNVSKISYPDGFDVNYTRDSNGNVTSIDTPKSSIEFKYDSFDELISRNDGKICETYDYDSMGRRTKTFENGIIKERLIYDNAGNLSDKISNILSTGTELKPGTYYADAYLYSYDKNGRLISENRRIKSKSSSVEYEYDDNDNIISETRGKNVTDYSYDDADRLVSRITSTIDNNQQLLKEKVDYVYDNLGNLVSEKSLEYEKTFEYDAEGKMISSNVSTLIDNTEKESSNETKLTESVESEYTYNALGLLDKKSSKRTTSAINDRLNNSAHKDDLSSVYAKDETYVYDYTKNDPLVLCSEISAITDEKYIKTFETTTAGRYLKQDKETDTEKNYDLRSNYVYRNDEKVLLGVDIESVVDVNYITTTTYGDNPPGTPTVTSKTKEDSHADEYVLSTDSKGSVTKAYNTDGELVSEIKYGTHGNVENLSINDKYMVKGVSTTGTISDATLSSKTILSEELKTSDILPSYTSYVYSDELRSLQNEKYTKLVSNDKFSDDGTSTGKNTYTTWYAFERFYSTIDKRFNSKDPVVGTIYEPERVNSYIYAGDNPLTFSDRDGRSFTCDIVNSRIFNKARDLCDTISKAINCFERTIEPIVKTISKAYECYNKVFDKIPTPVKFGIGLAGAAIACATGVGTAVVAGALVKSAISGAAFGAAMYGISAIATGEFSGKELVSSIINGAADMVMFTGATLGIKGAIECATRNADKIQKAMHANEAGELNVDDKFTNFLKDESGEFRFGKGGSGSIKYGELDSLGRTTGVEAVITPDMIGTGSPAKSSIRPAGFGGQAQGHARGHLLGNQLGGSGSDPRNLMTIYQNPVNHPVMSSIEANVRKAVEGGQIVNYKVTPIYNGNNLIPRGITIQATGNDGFYIYQTILNGK